MPTISHADSGAPDVSVTLTGADSFYPHPLADAVSSPASAKPATRPFPFPVLVSPLAIMPVSPDAAPGETSRARRDTDFMGRGS